MTMTNMSMRYTSFHNASMSFSQRRGNNTSRKDEIVHTTNTNKLGKLLLEAREATRERKKIAARSYQKKKNENKRKIWSDQTESTQLDTARNNLVSALESVRAEEQQEIADAKSTRSKLKNEVYKKVREEKREAHESLLVNRSVYKMFAEDLEELRERVKNEKV